MTSLQAHRQSTSHHSKPEAPLTVPLRLLPSWTQPGWAAAGLTTEHKQTLEAIPCTHCSLEAATVMVGLSQGGQPPQRLTGQQVLAPRQVASAWRTASNRGMLNMQQAVQGVNWKAYVLARRQVAGAWHTCRDGAGMRGDCVCSRRWRS
jgi:hypothetical protein